MLGRMILAAGLAVTLAAPASAQNCAFVYPYSTLGGICAEIQEQQAIRDSERLNDRLDAARRAQSEEFDRSLREADQQRAMQEMRDGQASAMQEMRGTVAAMESREVDAQSARIDRADREDADRSSKEFDRILREADPWLAKRGDLHQLEARELRALVDAAHAPPLSAEEKLQLQEAARRDWLSSPLDPAMLRQRLLH
jgi:hypothetical protein